MKFYSGIGSRETPPIIQGHMIAYAHALEELGYVLRSGGAEGADAAFETGVTSPQNKRIYLPWAGFNGKQGIVCGRIPSLRDIAFTYHPTWGQLSEAVRKLMTRNSAIVLGYPPEPEPSQFVLCWTPEGKGGGGTGQALRIARGRHKIPVFDLAIPGAIPTFEAYLSGLSCA